MAHEADSAISNAARYLLLRKSGAMHKRVICSFMSPNLLAASQITALGSQNAFPGVAGSAAHMLEDCIPLPC